MIKHEPQRSLFQFSLGYRTTQYTIDQIALHDMHNQIEPQQKEPMGYITMTLIVNTTIRDTLSITFYYYGLSYLEVLHRLLSYRVLHHLSRTQIHALRDYTSRKGSPNDYLEAGVF